MKKEHHNRTLKPADSLPEINLAADNAQLRRITDEINNKKPSRKMNLDRRSKNSERRGESIKTYMGRVRRYTIDRRVAVKDRRKSE